VTIHQCWFAQEGCLITGWCLVGAILPNTAKFLTGQYDYKMNLILKATYKIQLALQLSSLNWIQQGQKLYPKFSWMQKSLHLGRRLGGGEANKIQRYLILRHWWIIYNPFSSSSIAQHLILAKRLRKVSLISQGWCALKVVVVLLFTHCQIIVCGGGLAC